VAELRPGLDLQEDLVVLAADVHDDGRLNYFIPTASVPSSPPAVRWLALAATALAIAGLTGRWLFGLPPGTVLAAVLPHVGMAPLLRRQTNRLLEPAFAARAAFGSVAAVLARLEHEAFAALRLQTLRQELRPEGQPASRRLRRFRWLLGL